MTNITFSNTGLEVYWGVAGNPEIRQFDLIYTNRKPRRGMASFCTRHSKERQYVYECRLAPEQVGLYQKMRGLLPSVLEEKLYMTEMILDKRKLGKVHGDGAAIARFASLGIRLSPDGPYYMNKNVSYRSKYGDGRWLNRSRPEEGEYKGEA